MLHYGNFHENMYAGAISHPCSYESGTVGFPHHNYTRSPPYDQSSCTPFYFRTIMRMVQVDHLLCYGAPGYPPISQRNTRTTSSYGFLACQPPIIDPAFFLMSILMRVHQMSLAWRTSEVPLGMIEKNPFSHVVKSNRGYHCERDVHSNSWYVEIRLPVLHLKSRKQ